MASFDFGSISAYKFARYGVVGSNTNASTPAIDTQGFEGVALVSAVGLSTLNAAATLTVSVELLESNDTNISNATAVASKYIISNPDLATSNVAVKATFKPTKRYVFATYVPTTNASANIATVGALGFPHNAPTT
jgi:hypothetical protein